ncbi:MAG: hypothetical protein EPGJADBJ_03618 [Saprospiraceae bacterium]|nr:hypothetical protein [Saprospiraceae bacterium]
MPIEIKELHIKGVIGQEPASKSDTSSTAGTGTDDQQEAIIAACVEKVLKILKDKKER